MTRQVPKSKTATLWQGARKEWYQRRADAYYSIAKELVLQKYPRWLGDHDLELPCVSGPPGAGADGLDMGVTGDVNAEAHAELLGVTVAEWGDWRTRRDRRERLFYSTLDDGYPEQSYGFDDRRWRPFVRRLARFMMFVDDRRAAQLAALERALAEFELLFGRGPLSGSELEVIDRRAAILLLVGVPENESTAKKPGILPGEGNR